MTRKYRIYTLPFRWHNKRRRRLSLGKSRVGVIRAEPALERCGGDRMCGSIREFGFKIPCLVRSDGEVIDGLKSARKLGFPRYGHPVRPVDPAQIKAFRIMVEPIGKRGQSGSTKLLRIELLDFRISAQNTAAVLWRIQVQAMISAALFKLADRWKP